MQFKNNNNGYFSFWYVEYLYGSSMIYPKIYSMYIKQDALNLPFNYIMDSKSVISNG